MSGLPSELTLVLQTHVNYRADLTFVRFIAVNYTLIEFYYSNLFRTRERVMVVVMFLSVSF